MKERQKDIPGRANSLSKNTEASTVNHTWEKTSNLVKRETGNSQKVVRNKNGKVEWAKL